MLEHADSNASYASFMLRLWLVWNGDRATWLASLDNTVTGSSRWFPSIEALATYFLAEYGTGAGTALAREIGTDVPPQGAA